MRVLFAGTPAPAVPSLLRLLDSSHDVVEVLTRPDAPAGRGRRETASPVALAAREAAVPVWQPTTLRDPAAAAHLANLAVDVVAVVAYGLLVPPDLLDVPTHGWVNLHFSLLPAWRGAAPVQHALLAGDEVTGATTFRLEEGLDTGPVLGTLTETVHDDDTTGSLLERLAVAGAQLLVATIDRLAVGDLVAVPQPDDGVSLAPRLTPQDAQLHWDRPALALSRQVRACSPAPGAWTTVDGQRLKVRRVADGVAADLRPGELASGPDGVLVGTGSAPLQLLEEQPAGRAAMAADAWWRGARLPEGTRLQ